VVSTGGGQILCRGARGPHALGGPRFEVRAHRTLLERPLNSSQYSTPRAVSSAIFPSGFSALKTADPATNTVAPAATSAAALLPSTPPSISISTWAPRESMRARSSAVFSIVRGMKDWPPNPGFTPIRQTRSRSSMIDSNAATGVWGFSATPAFMPASRMAAAVRCR